MFDFPIYLITDRKQTGGRPLKLVVEQALQAGIGAVQLREKDLPSRQLYELALELRQLTAAYQARLIINDRLDIAAATGADGVHLGIASLPVAVARRQLGAEAVIGYSAHSVDEALLAEQAGANFITFGPVFHTPSKAAYGEPVGLGPLKNACAVLKIPVYGLGGIKDANCVEAMAAGCTGIALISAITAAPDPQTATKMLLQKMQQCP